MTWEQLLKILKNMSEVSHTSLTTPVQILWDGVVYDLDAYESLSTGRLTFSILINEEEDDGEE